MSVILPARRFHQRSQPFKLQRFKSAARPDVTTGLRNARENEWRNGRGVREREREKGGWAKRCRNKSSFCRENRRERRPQRRYDCALHGKTCVACSYIILYGRLCPGYTLRSFTFKPRPRNIWPGGLIYTQA